MAAIASSSFCSQKHKRLPSTTDFKVLRSLSSSSLLFNRRRSFSGSSWTVKGRVVPPVSACSWSSSSFDELHARGRPRRYPTSKNSLLLNMIQEIEPLDVSLVQKEVPTDTIDAIKRTISSMLGLLPSDHFQVLVDASWGSLSKLLVSSIMTGYTMRNAEHRLCLERSLDIHEESTKNGEHSKNNTPELSLSDLSATFPSYSRSYTSPEENHVEQSGANMELDDLEKAPPSVKEYIQFLQSCLSSAKKELCEVKRKNSALEMQQHFVGEENNELLNYLRSLQPEKVVELSEPCQEVEEAIHSVVHGLLATLSPKMHSKTSPQSENASTGILGDEKDDPSEVAENTTFHFEPLISLTRDYLARLLFWCMLLGHFLRGLEYRLELMQLLPLVGEVETTSPNTDQVA